MAKDLGTTGKACNWLNSSSAPGRRLIEVLIIMEIVTRLGSGDIMYRQIGRRI